MNWTRGLFRAWLMASAVYAFTAGFFAWQAMWEARLAHNEFADLIPGFQMTSEEALRIAITVGLPPVILFVLGYGLLWVARGFNR